MSVLTSLFRRAHPTLAVPLTVAPLVQPWSPLSGVAKYPFDAPSGDVPGGPTHQPGVMPGHGYEALRTPFGDSSIPGAGRERNVTNLDLAANQHRDGYPFAAANGRSTRQVPRMRGARPADARSVDG